MTEAKPGTFHMGSTCSDTELWPFPGYASTSLKPRDGNVLVTLWISHSVICLEWIQRVYCCFSTSIQLMPHGLPDFFPHSSFKNVPFHARKWEGLIHSGFHRPADSLLKCKRDHLRSSFLTAGSRSRGCQLLLKMAFTNCYRNAHAQPFYTAQFQYNALAILLEEVNTRLHCDCDCDCDCIYL